MITISIDLTALMIGIFIGLALGFIVFGYYEMREGGPWSSGWTEGYKSGAELRKYIEKNSRSDNNAEQ